LKEKILKVLGAIANGGCTHPAKKISSLADKEIRNPGWRGKID